MSLLGKGYKETKMNDEVEVKEEVKKVRTPEAPNYTNEALGLFKDSDTNKWNVSVIKYNPYTKMAVVDNLVVCDDRATAIEKFKIMAVEKNIVG